MPISYPIPRGYDKNSVMEGIMSLVNPLAAPGLAYQLKTGFIPSKKALYVDYLKTDSPHDVWSAIKELVNRVRESGATKIMFHPEAVNEAPMAKRSMLDMANQLGAAKVPNELTRMIHPLELPGRITKGMPSDEWWRLYYNYPNYLYEAAKK